MIPLTLAEIAQIVGGTVAGDPEVVVDGAAFIDTRTPEPDGLFAAFAGEHVDGHDFVATAVEAGAAAVLGSRPTEAPTVVVEDVQTALQLLARWSLERLRRTGRLTVVAITGSQGKTSVKDLLAAVLAASGETVATAGSFNNELGLPLTVLRADVDTRFLVLEMGARGIGHLSQLTAIARPDVSLVLNVGKAHVGEFGSQANIAVAKGELVEALDETGVAVLNADDPLVAAMASRTRGRVLGFGAFADVTLGEITSDDFGRPSFTLSAEGTTVPVQLQLVGAHQAVNAAAAVAAAVAAGVPFGDACRAVQGVTGLSKWRMELRERADGLVVLNDAYNANPDSMRAALEALASIGTNTDRRAIAVLGEMRELGESSAAEHAELGRLAAEAGVELIVVGEGARAAHEANDTSVFVETVDDAIDLVRKNVAGAAGPKPVVLVKASRAGRFERIAEALLQDQQDDGPEADQ